MQNSAVNFRHIPGILPVPLKLIASGLVLGLFGIQVAAANTQPANAPRSAQPQRVAQANATNTQLVGLWQARPSRAGAPPLKFVFGSDGKLFIVLPTNPQRPQALELRYRINANPKPMHLDLIASGNQSAQTIFEFTPDRKLRLELQGLSAGRPRPTGFTANAMVFDKVSNTATLPAGAQIVQPGRGNSPIPGVR